MFLIASLPLLSPCLWHSGLCTQTFYGHLNSCNAATFNLMGTVLASTDADGMLKLWDTRMVAEILSINTGKHPANKAAFDRSGQVGGDKEGRVAADFPVSEHMPCE
jgi:WD40 repeat protein